MKQHSSSNLTYLSHRPTTECSPMRRTWCEVCGKYQLEIFLFFNIKILKMIRTTRSWPLDVISHSMQLLLNILIENLILLSRDFAVTFCHNFPFISPAVSSCSLAGTRESVYFLHVVTPHKASYNTIEYHWRKLFVIPHTLIIDGDYSYRTKLQSNRCRKFL